MPQFVMPRTTPPEFRIRVPVVFAILDGDVSWLVGKRGKCSAECVCARGDVVVVVVVRETYSRTSARLPGRTCGCQSRRLMCAHVVSGTDCAY